MVMTENKKREYKEPRMKMISSQFQGILCDSLEPINPGEGHDW